MMGRPLEEMGVVNNRTKTFIKRERVRRNLIHTKPGEKICLQYEEVALLLSWLKELETEVKELTPEIQTKRVGV